MATPVGPLKLACRARSTCAGWMVSVDDQRDEHATIAGSCHVEAMTGFHVAIEGGALT